MHASNHHVRSPSSTSSPPKSCFNSRSPAEHLSNPSSTGTIGLSGSKYGRWSVMLVGGNDANEKAAKSGRRAASCRGSVGQRARQRKGQAARTGQVSTVGVPTTRKMDPMSAKSLLSPTNSGRRSGGLSVDVAPGPSISRISRSRLSSTSYSVSPGSHSPGSDPAEEGGDGISASSNARNISARTAPSAQRSSLRGS